MSEKKDDSWEMPKPVFKTSEGSLPRSLEETISQSFIANADTLEIDEDDDILGIMDPALISQPMNFSSDGNEESILETGPEPAAEPAPVRAAEPAIMAEPEAAGGGVPSPSDEPAAAEPMTVTDQPPIAEPAVKAEAKSAVGSESSFFIYILVGLVAVGLAVLYYYLVLKKP